MANKRERIRPLKKVRALCPATGKVRYRDHHNASLALRTYKFTASALASRGESHTIAVVRSYRCPECRGWHLTSRPARPGHQGVGARRPVGVALDESAGTTRIPRA